MTGEKFLVLGPGLSGYSAVKILKQFNYETIYLAGEGEAAGWPRYEQLLELLGENYLIHQDQAQATSFLANITVLVLSPGIARTHPLVAQAIKQGIQIWSEVELAYRHCQVPILAITGTNGKTTTCTLLAQALESAGKKVFLGGNIGTPLCDLIAHQDDFDYAVWELSSFQLESIDTFKPQLCALLNLAFNHGERYDNIEDYALSKLQILKNLDGVDQALVSEDFLVYDQRSFTQVLGNVDDLALYRSKYQEIEWDDFVMGHKHNQLNLYVVAWFLEQLNLSVAAINPVIREFRGVAHRLQKIETSQFLGDVFNDAKSTNWPATFSALKSIFREGRRLCLICGGQRRGVGDGLAPEQIDELIKWRPLILTIGEAGPFIKESLSKTPLEVHHCDNLKGAWNHLKETNFSGDILFSPAYPSFDQFNNYVARGEAFIKIFN